MKEKDLRNGVVVCHVKHGRYYVVDECNMRYKDSVEGWVDGVSYCPMYENQYNMFVRSRKSFLDEFELYSDDSSHEQEESNKGA